MPAWAIILIVFGCLIVFLGIIFAIWWISTYNGLIKLRNNAEEGYSTMDVSMKKRYDLIPNLVETVKGFAKHEKETLEGVMEARYACMSANDPEERAQKENMLAGTLKTFKAGASTCAIISIAPLALSIEIPTIIATKYGIIFTAI